MQSIFEKYNKISRRRCLPAASLLVPESHRLPPAEPNSNYSSALPSDSCRPEPERRNYHISERRKEWNITLLHVLLIALVVAVLALMASVWSLAFLGTHMPQKINDRTENILLDVSDFEFIPEEENILIDSDSTNIDISPDMFDEIIPPAANVGTFTFSLSPDAPVPVLSGNSIADIDDALSQLDGYPVGFFFMDMQTGTGCAYNIDENIYGASSFKAPFAAYVLSHIYDVDGLSSEQLSQVISSVEVSDNDAFVSLSDAYRHSDDFDAWLDDLSIDNDEMFSLGDFATYSVRDAAKLWDFMYDYMDSGAEGAAILSDATASTNVSFIRDGVESAADSELIEWETDDGALVMAEVVEAVAIHNKAGWLPEEGTFASTSDNAIISIGDRDYMMCILTAAPAYETYQNAVADLARAFFDARDDISMGNIQ